MTTATPTRAPLVRALRIGSLVAAWLVAPTAFAQPQLPPLRIDTLATGLTPLSSVTSAGDERLFITTLDGRVLVWTGDEIRQFPFLNLQSRVKSGGEQGLFSVAFHPDWPAAPFLFVNYTNLDGNTVVARFRDLGDTAKRRSSRIVITIAQPFANHNGGQLQFGPDRYLYIGMGDGGSGNDPQCNAQRGGTLLGKMLRIDVQTVRRRAPRYDVPPDNPWAGGGAQLPEVWAIGLRNPWRFSFDRATGDLFIGDVGQGAREEIDLQQASSAGGENYGWAREEGTACVDRVSACPGPVPACGSPALKRPILDYGRAGGACAVIGGYVYRGSAIPGLRGVYIYGDFCTGQLFGAARDAGGVWRSTPLAPRFSGLNSFGEDADGEIYLVSNGGVLARLVPG
jgi:glucose/arabinose dehydrogenase